jgi:hypothetical protein
MRQITQAEFRKDPSRYVREAKQEPIQVVDEGGKLRGTISFPQVTDAEVLGCAHSERKVSSTDENAKSKP